MTLLPDYDDLPLNPSTGRRNAWGLFGEDDNVGLLNLITPQRVVGAAKLVLDGRVFPLDAPVDAFDPPLSPARTLVKHTLVHEKGSIHFDDRHDGFYPQGSSQWDSLGHVGVERDSFYNGASEDDIISGRRNTIDHWARRGIVGRGVLLDVAAVLARRGEDFDPASKFPITVDHLEEARTHAGVEFEPGDILILHTGFTEWCINGGREAREAIRQTLHAVGLEPSEAIARYLWNAHAAALGSDTFAIEAFPPNYDDPYGFLHRVLIGEFGMALGELWATAALADACRADGRYTFMVSSTPMNAPGGVGSPANVLAIR